MKCPQSVNTDGIEWSLFAVKTEGREWVDERATHLNV